MRNDEGVSSIMEACLYLNPVDVISFPRCDIFNRIGSISEDQIADALIVALNAQFLEDPKCLFLYFLIYRQFFHLVHGKVLWGV